MANYVFLYSLNVGAHSTNSRDDDYDSGVHKYLIMIDGNTDNLQTKCSLVRDSDSHSVFSGVIVSTGHPGTTDPFYVSGKGYFFVLPSEGPPIQSYTFSVQNDMEVALSVSIYQWS